MLAFDKLCLATFSKVYLNKVINTQEQQERINPFFLVYFKINIIILKYSDRYA